MRMYLQEIEGQVAKVKSEALQTARQKVPPSPPPHALTHSCPRYNHDVARHCHPSSHRGIFRLMWSCRNCGRSATASWSRRRPSRPASPQQSLQPAPSFRRPRTWRCPMICHVANIMQYSLLPSTPVSDCVNCTVAWACTLLQCLVSRFGMWWTPQ